MSDARRTVDPSAAAGNSGELAEPQATPRAEDASPAQSADGGRAQAAAEEAKGRQAAVEAEPAPGADEDALRGDVDELIAVAAQRDEYLALAQRTQADFENYRKRVAKESIAAQERGVAKLAVELLPALDNLDRALEEGAAAAERDGRDSSLLEGLRLVRSELHAALARAGVESFSPKGQPFDPAEHEAMAQQPVPGVTSGTVAEVFQPGYRLGQNVIRAARVLVAA